MVFSVMICVWGRVLCSFCSWVIVLGIRLLLFWLRLLLLFLMIMVCGCSVIVLLISFVKVLL